jgi:antitoxin FitA
MPRTVQIRDLDDDVHRRLRVRAAQQGLSLAEYLRREVTGIAYRPTMADFLQRAAATASTPVATEAIVAALRADRDER